METLLAENIAALSADVHSIDDLDQWFSDHPDSRERLRLIIEAAEVLTAEEPPDYEAAQRDWILTVEKVAEELVRGAAPARAVRMALEWDGAREP